MKVNPDATLAGPMIVKTIIEITVSRTAGSEPGWARPAFSPGAYHVKLDGERIELMFYRGRHATGNEFEPCK